MACIIQYIHVLFCPSRRYTQFDCACCTMYITIDERPFSPKIQHPLSILFARAQSHKVANQLKERRVLFFFILIWKALRHGRKNKNEKKNTYRTWEKCAVFFLLLGDGKWNCWQSCGQWDLFGSCSCVPSSSVVCSLHGAPLHIKNSKSRFACRFVRLSDAHRHTPNRLSQIQLDFWCGHCLVCACALYFFVSYRICLNNCVLFVVRFGIRYGECVHDSLSHYDETNN